MRPPAAQASPHAKQEAATPDALRQDSRSAKAGGSGGQPELENPTETPLRPVEGEQMIGNPFREKGAKPSSVYEPSTPAM